MKDDPTCCRYFSEQPQFEERVYFMPDLPFNQGSYTGSSLVPLQQLLDALNKTNMR